MDRCQGSCLTVAARREIRVGIPNKSSPRPLDMTPRINPQCGIYSLYRVLRRVRGNVLLSTPQSECLDQTKHSGTCLFHRYIDLHANRRSPSARSTVARMPRPPHQHCLTLCSHAQYLAPIVCPRGCTLYSSVGSQGSGPPKNGFPCLRPHGMIIRISRDAT